MSDGASCSGLTRASHAEGGSLTSSRLGFPTLRYVSAKNDGGWIVWVAIADVAAYVRPGTALDREARAKGNSTYFPDRVEPMLPEVLSNGLCSLKQGENRACMAVRMVFDKAGRKTGHRFVRGLMRSHAKLSYEQAQEAIDGPRSLLQTVAAAKDSLNPGLHFIGILPNQVMDTPFQKENLAAIVQHFANLLIALPEGGFALIRRTTAIEESQAEGVPIWKHAKTSARDAWRKIEPSFAHIASTMGVFNTSTQGAAHHGH